MDRREYLQPSRFGNAEKRRLLESKNLKERRSNRRATNFNLRRDIVEELNKNTIENIPPKPDKAIDRKLALQKFKAERIAKQEALKNKKKPPFVVGIMHHGSSPLLRNLNVPTANKEVKKMTNIHEVRNKRITRATTRMQQGNVLKGKSKCNEPQNIRVLKPLPTVKVFPFNERKTVFTFYANKIAQSGKKLTSPHTPTVLKRSVQKSTLKSVSNSAKKFKKSPANSKVDKEIPNDKEVLAAPLEPEEDETAAVRGPEFPVEKRNTMENASPLVIKVEKKEDEGIDLKNENNEIANQVAFQHSRLQSETIRLVELADQWQTLALRDSLPQEVVDEVDSVVGQTRLLTRDKFQQFRGLIIQYEQQLGNHPVTLDDLNGFWDMVYLQVESLDKKYESLEALKNNNWVKPEPVSRKKRRPVKNLKVKKETEIDKLSTPKKKKTDSQAPEVHTPTTNKKPLISKILLSEKRTRSNSPSSYIAMRLSGVGRLTTNKVQTNGTPLSSVETFKTPKRTLKKEGTPVNVSSSTPSVEVNIEEALQKAEPSIVLSLPKVASKSKVQEDGVFTAARRRSTRLANKVTFDSEIREKQCSSCRPPVTPYRKAQADS